MKPVTILGKHLDEFDYRYASGLWVVTPYYNPVGYKTRRTNYEIFVHLLRRSGIPVLTVECAFGDQPFDLPESTDVVKIRSSTLLWQKERLLKLAISWLPPSCKYVAWHDCDLIFANPNWAQEMVAQLQRFPIVQSFETCNRLPQEYSGGGAAGQVCTSFASIVGNNPHVLASGRYEDHGHPGYAWAARREVLDEHGLYEYAVAGSADHYMAHAAVGDLDSPCIARMMFNRAPLMECFRVWAEAFDRTVQGRLGVVSGEVLHLWHGELQNRQYRLRQRELAKLDFNPLTDIVVLPGKPLELKPGINKPGLREWFASYFTSRQEDGAQLAT